MLSGDIQKYKKLHAEILNKMEKKKKGSKR